MASLRDRPEKKGVRGSQGRGGQPTGENTMSTAPSTNKTSTPSTDARIYVAGHRGMVGSALIRRLSSKGYRNLVTRSRRELDLLDQPAVFRFMREERPDYIFLAAAKVGGIQANNRYRADFIYQNLAVECNVIHGAFAAGVRGLM